MPILRLKIQERLNAISIGYNYASEPFYIFEDFEIYRNHLSKLKKIIADEELDKLKNKINDIRNIRKITNKYFEQIELK